jgi:hypothetical protein
MGGTLGTAIFLSVLFNGLPDKIASAFRSAATTPEFRSAVTDPAVRANPANKPVLEMLTGGGSGGTTQALNDSSFINHLDPRLARPFLVGFSDSISVVFLLGAVVIAVAFAIVWWLPEEKLRTQSGLQARQAEADGGAATRSEVPDGAVDAGGAAAMIPGAGSTDTPPHGEAGHGRHGIVVANGHHAAEIADGHRPIEHAHGRHAAPAPEEEPVESNR